MADNVAVTPGSGKTIAADEVTDATLGTVQVQFIKIMDGTLDGTSKAAVGPNGLAVSAAQAGTWNVRNQDGSGNALTSATRGAQQALSTQIVDASGNQITQFGAQATSYGSTFPTTGIGIGFTDGSNMVAGRIKAASTAPVATDPALVVALSPNSIALGAGASNATTQRVTVDSGQLATLQIVAQAMSAGYQLVALPTDQAVPNKVQAQANGSTSSRVVAAASTNATSLKASAGNLENIDVFNVAAYDVFLKFYNKASAPTVGTDTPVWTIPIKAGTGYARTFPYGKSFATGIAYAITKLQADSDTTVLVAGDVTGAIDWV